MKNNNDSPHCGMDAKLYLKNAVGIWMEIEGFIRNIELSRSIDSLNSNVPRLPSATIEINITGSRILQASEDPSKDCYDEWEKMVLKGIH